MIATHSPKFNIKTNFLQPLQLLQPQVTHKNAIRQLVSWNHRNHFNQSPTVLNMTTSSLQLWNQYNQQPQKLIWPNMSYNMYN